MICQSSPCTNEFVSYRPHHIYCSVKCRVREGAREVKRKHGNDYVTKWRKNHPERVRAWRRARYYRRKTEGTLRRYPNPDLDRARWNRNKNRRRGVLSTLTHIEWIAILRAWDGKCAYCQMRAGTTQDHVIPVSKGGTHTLDNVVPACPSCNASKKDLDLDVFLERLLA